MGIEPTFKMTDIRKQLEKKADLIRRQIIRRLMSLGEMCIGEARTNKGYEDQTGALTSSIGYVVVDHGKVIRLAGFEKPMTAAIDSTGTADDGVLEGKQLAESLANKVSTKGYALIVVAGMHYAMHVEAMGLNVIGSSELLAERQLPEMLRKLKGNISKMN
ncbi:hypothetical protein [Albibacterium profundi]|uniref:Dinitrogenase iron-molybdenum cofactor biosynthesis domain-containing protein n=1 Tax=Albibacterium profundi TaxID=3134906 RepID=A0ABV5CEY8_9SPHI